MVAAACCGRSVVVFVPVLLRGRVFGSVIVRCAAAVSSSMHGVGFRRWFGAMLGIWGSDNVSRATRSRFWGAGCGCFRSIGAVHSGLRWHWFTPFWCCWSSGSCRSGASVFISAMRPGAAVGWWRHWRCFCLPWGCFDLKRLRQIMNMLMIFAYRTAPWFVIVLKCLLDGILLMSHLYGQIMYATFNNYALVTKWKTTMFNTKLCCSTKVSTEVNVNPMANETACIVELCKYVYWCLLLWLTPLSCMVWFCVQFGLSVLCPNSFPDS